MRPLGALDPRESARLVGVVFDLDDTLLTHGALDLEAYAALFQLRRAGLELVACTGRPAGWAAVVARQWPVAACIAENGAIAFAREGRALVRIDRATVAERCERGKRLAALVAEVERRHDDLVRADDAFMRITDVAFDIGEQRSLAPERVLAIRADAEALGLRTVASSIHLHLTLEADDKASGTLWLLASRHGEDPTGARSRFAFVGDSENDAACFAAFHSTFGVANARAAARRLSVPPRYLSSSERGVGFAEIASALVTGRGSAA